MLLKSAGLKSQTQLQTVIAPRKYRVPHALWMPDSVLSAASHPPGESNPAPLSELRSWFIPRSHSESAREGCLGAQCSLRSGAVPHGGFRRVGASLCNPVEPPLDS